ncbi:MAG: hypothetical protein K2X81_21680 [Candidatus Obscuribacterales bacterium]|nr:hypothetical protein [Candidatus Obscuribacterales bacterium]
MKNFKTAVFGIICAVLMLSLGGCKWGKDDDSKKPTPATGYEITSYVEGKAVRNVTAENYTANANSVDYHLAKKDKDGSDTGSFQGTWVVKHNSWKPVKGDGRYQATLYSGKVAIGTWTVHNFSTDTQSVLLFPADGSEVLRVSGTVVITEVKAGRSDAATARVTASSGDNVVYSKDVSWTKVLGFHLEAQPSDGSGYVYIWGNFKSEKLTK